MISIDNGPMRPEDWRIVVSKRLPRLDGHPRDPEDMDDWVTAGRQGRWTRAMVIAGLAALIMDFKGFRVMPGHLAEKIGEQRERIRAQWYCPDPPRSLADDPAAEIAWRRAAQRDYADRALIALASGDPLDDVPMSLDPETAQARPEIPEARRRLDAMVADVAASRVIPAATEDDPPDRALLDPERMAEARDEIDTVRHMTTAEVG